MKLKPSKNQTKLDPIKKRAKIFHLFNSSFTSFYFFKIGNIIRNQNSYNICYNKQCQRSPASSLSAENGKVDSNSTARATSNNILLFQSLMVINLPITLLDVLNVFKDFLKNFICNILLFFTDFFTKCKIFMYIHSNIGCTHKGISPPFIA